MVKDKIVRHVHGVLDSSLSRTLTTALIFAETLVLMFATLWDFSVLNERMHHTLEFVEHLSLYALTLLTIEIVMFVLVFGRSIFDSRLVKFDVFLVIATFFLEVVVFPSMQEGHFLGYDFNVAISTYARALTFKRFWRLVRLGNFMVLAYFSHAQRGVLGDKKSVKPSLRRSMRSSQDLQHITGPFASFLHDDLTEAVLTIILAGEWICSFLHLLDTEDIFSEHVSAQMHHVRYFSQIAVAMLVCDMGLIFVSYGPQKFLNKKHNVFYLVYTVLTAVLESYVMPNAGPTGYLQAEFPATTIHRILVTRRIWNFARPLLMGYLIEQLFGRVAGPVHEHVNHLRHRAHEVLIRSTLAAHIASRSRSPTPRRDRSVGKESSDRSAASKRTVRSTASRRSKSKGQTSVPTRGRSIEPGSGKLHITKSKERKVAAGNAVAREASKARKKAGRSKSKTEGRSKSKDGTTRRRKVS